MKQSTLSIILIISLSLFQFTIQDTRQIYTGMNIDVYNPKGQPSPSDINTIHADFVRIEFKNYNPSNISAAYAYYDPYINQYTSAGIKILFTLDYSSCPGKPSDNATIAEWNSYITNFVAVVGDIASHYQNQIFAYEIWNEPDLASPSSAYDPTLPAYVYGPLLKFAYLAVKKYSSADVVVGGLCSGNPQYLSDAINSTANTLYADGVGIHPYGQRPTSNWPTPTWGFGVLTTLLQEYVKISQGKPLWVTEIGTDDLSVQGNFPFNAFDAINSQMASECPYVFWFCWSDGMVNPFGVVNSNGTIKPSYSSFQSFGERTLSINKEY